MDTVHRYLTIAHWVTARRGIMKGEAIPLQIDFTSPPEFQGEAGLWTPEHFLVAAVSACFMSTFRSIAEFSKFEAVALDVETEGVLEKGEGGYSFTKVVVRPRLTIARESDRERALRLLEKSERACLVSRSLKSEITLEPLVTVATAVPAGD